MIGLSKPFLAFVSKDKAGQQIVAVNQLERRSGKFGKPAAQAPHAAFEFGKLDQAMRNADQVGDFRGDFSAQCSPVETS